LQFILAGVGKNIFNRPEVLTEYLLRNKAILFSSLIYILLVIVVVQKLKVKD